MSEPDINSRSSANTILLVEDQTIVALAERKMLERFGYAVETAATGERAVELANDKRQIALVLMDIDLGPGIDGTEAARRILELRRLPIVFLTAHAEPEYVERMRSITRYGYLLKGSAEVVLRSTIETAFELFYSHERTRLQEAKYEYLFNSTLAAVALVDKNGSVVQTNAEFTRLFGFTAEEAQGQYIDALIVPEALRAEGVSLTQRVVAGDEVCRSTRRRRKDGREVDVEVRAGRAQIGEEWLAHVIFYDIGPHKRAEEKLQYHYELQEMIAEVSAAFVHTPPTQIDDAVQLALEQMGRCLRADRVYVFRFTENGTHFTNTHEWCADGVKPVINELQDVPIESCPWLVAQHVSGRVLTIEDIERDEHIPSEASRDRELLRSQSICALLNLPLQEHNRVVGFIGFDIVGRTRRWLDEEVAMLQVVGSILSAASIMRQAHQEVIELLDEKELILREVHHRVKNNMHTVMSLLSLQADRLSESAAAAALREANNRLRSMGMLYDKLYRTEHVGEVSIKSYLTELVHETAASFPNGGEVSVETEIADVVIGVRPLSTVGIIVNELVTNSMKHAFVGHTDADARLTVVASREGAWLRIAVRDNGVGIPELDEEDEANGFGLQLVQMLTEQLGGSLRVNRERGSAFALEFKP